MLINIIRTPTSIDNIIRTPTSIDYLRVFT